MLLFSLSSALSLFGVFYGRRGGGTTQQLCSAPSQQRDGSRSLGARSAFLHLVPRPGAAPLRVSESRPRADRDWVSTASSHPLPTALSHRVEIIGELLWIIGEYLSVGFGVDALLCIYPGWVLSV